MTSFAIRMARLLPPETAHRAALLGLRCGFFPADKSEPATSLRSEFWGLRFLSPIGLAAGFDKNAEGVDALLAQGFGFVEAGTVTPRPQPGNPRPRLFRLREDQAVINRLGFNSRGLDFFVRNLRRRRGMGVVGANLGKNKGSADAISDYLAGLRAVYLFADYAAINISSPNTQGLRDLQAKEALDALLSAVMQSRAELAEQTGKRLPLLLKIAPDLSMAEREDIAQVALLRGIDGLIVSNTSVSRPADLHSPQAKEPGGLSGHPLFALSTEVLASMYRLTEGKIPMIGVGGISSGADAYAKIRAGASLVQLYTALVYEGFGIIKRIQRELAELLERDGLTSISQAVGVDARAKTL